MRFRFLTTCAMAVLLVPALALAQPLVGPVQSGNFGSTPFTATGGSAARSLADRAADVINAADYGFSASASAAANRTALVNTISRGCSLGKAVITLPAGSFNVDYTAGEIQIPCKGISIRGAGQISTVLLPQGTTGNFLHFLPAAGQQWGGGSSLTGFRIFTSSNPTSGALLFLDHVDGIDASDIEIDGGYYNVQIISSLHVWLNRGQLSGGNTNSGSTMIVYQTNETTVSTNADTPTGSVLPFASTAGIAIGDTAICTNVPTNATVTAYTTATVTLSAPVSGDVPSATSCEFRGINNSETWVTDFNIRSNGGPGLYSRGAWIQDADGIYWNSVHVGFATNEAVRVEQQFSDTKLTGLQFTAVIFDTAAYGIRFAQGPGTITQYTGQHAIIGSSCELQTTECVRVDDAYLQGLRLTGYHGGYVGTNDIDIQAGSDISITGGEFLASNNSGGGGAHILIGGTAQRVTVSGMTFRTGWNGAFAVANNVQITGSADYVTFGGNNFSGASSSDLSVTTSGTHIYLGLANTSDRNNAPWGLVPWNSNATTQYRFETSGGIPMLQVVTSGANSSVDYVKAQSNGAGGGASVTVAGADGTAAALNVLSGTTGALNLVGGTSTNLKLGSTVIGAITSASTLLSNHFGGNGTAPTLGACGTTPALSTGANDNHGTITTGTGTFSSCVITWAAAHTNAPNCLVQAQAGGSTPAITPTTTGLTITTVATSAKFAYWCPGQ